MYMTDYENSYVNPAALDVNGDGKVNNEDLVALKQYINELFAQGVLEISHSFKNGKIYFTVVTCAGDYNRVKVALLDNIKSYVVYSDKYTVNEKGQYVWTFKAINAPSETTVYAVNIRRASTNRYITEYTYHEVEITEENSVVKSVSYEIIAGKLLFTVVTEPGSFNRVKVALANNETGYVKYTDVYTVNENGDYVWTFKGIDVPEEKTSYAADVRDANTMKYLRKFSYFEVDPVSASIKSVSYVESGDNLVFTVTTKPGNFDRVRCGLTKSLVNNLKYTTSYTVADNGDFVWTLKVPKPTENSTLYFDLRNADTNAYIKDFFLYDYVA